MRRIVRGRVDAGCVQFFGSLEVFESAIRIFDRGEGRGKVLVCKSRVSTPVGVFGIPCQHAFEVGYFLRQKRQCILRSSKGGHALQRGPELKLNVRACGFGPCPFPRHPERFHSDSGALLRLLCVFSCVRFGHQGIDQQPLCRAGALRSNQGPREPLSFRVAFQSGRQIANIRILRVALNVAYLNVRRRQLTLEALVAAGISCQSVEIVNGNCDHVLSDHRRARNRRELILKIKNDMAREPPHLVEALLRAITLLSGNSRFPRNRNGYTAESNHYHTHNRRPGNVPAHKFLQLIGCAGRARCNRFVVQIPPNIRRQFRCRSVPPRLILFQRLSHYRFDIAAITAVDGTEGGGVFLPNRAHGFRQLPLADGVG